VHRADTSSYLSCAISTYLGVSVIIIDMRKETVKFKWCELLLDAFQFIGISRCNRIPNNTDIFEPRSNSGEISYVYTSEGWEGVGFHLNVVWKGNASSDFAWESNLSWCSFADRYSDRELISDLYVLNCIRKMNPSDNYILNAWQNFSFFPPFLLPFL
jgi:hypothetical protein